jgi:hypothetical protein
MLEPGSLVLVITLAINLPKFEYMTEGMNCRSQGYLDSLEVSNESKIYKIKHTKEELIH